MSPVIGFSKALTKHPEKLQGLSYAWLEAPLAARLACLADVPNWQDLTVWPSGRLFGEPGEYRWQRNADGTLHAVLLLENPPLPDGFEDPMELSQEDEADLILWGEWVDPKKDPQGNPDGGPSFYANEIPHVQTYPLDLKSPAKEDQTPRLVIRRYRAVKEDEGEFVRCVGFTMKGRGGVTMPNVKINPYNFVPLGSGPIRTSWSHVTTHERLQETTYSGAWFCG
jgi:hypothetical protein